MDVGRGAGQALGEVVGQRPAQIGAALVDAGDALAFQMRREAAPDGFHLWQFWHFPPIRCMVPP